MKRIHSLIAATCLATSAWAGHLEGVPQSELRQLVPPVLKQVAPDLYFFYNDASSNSAFLVTGAGVLVIDTGQHPADGRALLERIRKITDKPVKWVINTHAHGDHFLGNPVFRDAGATLVAHRDTAVMMKTHYQYEIGRRGAYFNRFKLDPKELALVLPDLTYDSSMTITLGNRTVQVMYLGAGQNPGDTRVHFPHARALFAGGPFARRNWSNTSFTPSIDGWIALLNRIAAMDVDLYLPGHGDVGTKQDVLDEAPFPRIQGFAQLSADSRIHRGAAPPLHHRQAAHRAALNLFLRPTLRRCRRRG